MGPYPPLLFGLQVFQWLRFCFFSPPFVCVLQHPDSKMMQINLTGFLNGKNAREFMKDLWPLLLSAQENIAGIPSAFLEQKKEEIKQRQVSFSKWWKQGWARSR